MVGLLTFYSNHADQVKRLQRLLDLPERQSTATSRTLPRVRRRPTKAQRMAMITAYQSGETIRQIATHMGFHRDAVSAVLAQADIPRRYHQTVTVDLQRVNQLQAEGLTLTQIAERLGVGRTTIVRARRERRS